MRKSIIVVLALFFLVGFSLTHMALSGSIQNNQKEEVIPIQEGPMTEKQKEHSKLYENYSILLGHRRLRDRLASTPDDIVTTIGPRERSGSTDQSISNNIMQDLACRADAVVIAIPKSRSSHLTENEDFVFTDYEMTVQEVLKDNAVAHIQLNNDITMTRPGGTIQLNGHSVKALDVSFQPFQGGKRYLLFLSFIPTTGAYKSVSSTGSFQLGNKVVPLTTESLLAGKNFGDSSSFLSDIQTAVANACR
jgi:hypothetical protein